MRRDTLTALAERCEKAQGQDRELDAEIYEFVPFAFPREGKWRTCHADLPPYTRSLDAAVAFVGEMLPDFFWGVSLGVPGRQGGQYWGSVYAKKGDIGWVWPGEAELHPGTTPALALMSAALRALAEQEGE